MKRIIILILIATACFSQVFAQEDTTSKQTDTVVTEWEDIQESTNDAVNTSKKRNIISSDKWDWDFGSPVDSGMALAFISVILIFGLPFFIIFLAFFFKYKNRKAKYKLIEQALASGQPLPENFLKEVGNDQSTRNKGITNIFTGIGLFIFLWAITGNFGVGCIGLLVMFIGIGQAVIYNQRPRNNNKDGQNSGY